MALGTDFIGEQRRTKRRHRFTGSCFVSRISYPHFRTCLRIRQLAHCPDRIRIQNVIVDAHAGQRVGHQLCFQQGTRAVNPLHCEVRSISLATDADNQVDAFGDHAVGQGLQATDLHVLGVDIRKLAAIDFV